MKTLKEIKKDYYEKDWKAMRDGLKYLKVFKVKEDRGGLQYYEKANKTELKKADAETFWSGVYRATFHLTAVREINGEFYFFKNNYLFN